MEEKSLRSTVLEMKVGDELVWPITRRDVVKSTAATLTLSANRRFRTRTDREKGEFYVTRIQ